jgi:hypothetical protein
MIAGAIVVGAVLITEVKYQPPFWVHAALWIPLILIVTLWPLRGLKSLLISLQYHHEASQATLKRRSLGNQKSSASAAACEFAPNPATATLMIPDQIIGAAA